MNKASGGGEARAVLVRAGAASLEGELTIPVGARGVVLFAHGSGSSRHSPRNRFVAARLREGGSATLLFDLLTEDEEREDDHTGRLRFDIALLAGRLVRASEWVMGDPRAKHLALGYFGSSTGGAAALVAAAATNADIRAVVSRGGRPDLAGDALSRVRAPTLLIVGGRDDFVLDLNERALTRLHCEKRMEVVPEATHLFEEVGALETVAHLASDWFSRHWGDTTASRTA